MKVELEEFRTEATHLKNQQATIRRLEERNRQLEQQVSDAFSIDIFARNLNPEWVRFLEVKEVHSLLFGSNIEHKFVIRNHKECLSSFSEGGNDDCLSMNMHSDGGKNKRSCGDQATQSGWGESENTWGFEREV